MDMDNEEQSLRDKYGIHWYDDDHTILVCEPPRNWRWDDAYNLLKIMNDDCSTVTHGVYSIFHHEMNSASTLPHGNAMPHLRRLMSITHENDELTVFVGINVFARRILEMAGKLYGFRNLMSDMRFADDMTEAIDIINAHKTQKQRNA